MKVQEEIKSKNENCMDSDTYTHMSYKEARAIMDEYLRFLEEVTGESNTKEFVYLSKGKR